MPSPAEIPLKTRSNSRGFLTPVLVNFHSVASIGHKWGQTPDYGVCPRFYGFTRFYGFKRILCLESACPK